MTNLELIEEIERRMTTGVVLWLTPPELIQLRTMTDMGWDYEPIWGSAGVKNYMLQLRDARAAVKAAYGYLASNVAKELTK